MRFFSLLFILVSVSFNSQTSRADPGDLDTGFGNNGIVTSDFGNSEVINDLILSGNGQILVSGTNLLNPGLPNEDISFFLASYDSDGVLTPGFGSGGTDLGHPAESNGLGMQSSGKIIVAGHIDLDDNLPYDAFVVARYNADGSLDTNFGTNNGWGTIDFTGDELARGMAIQDDDKIVVVGGVDSDMSGDPEVFAVARFNADGTPDNGFGNMGAVTTDFAGKTFAQARAVAIQGNGQIVVGGNISDPNILDFALARYNAADGSLDMSFGSGGRVSSVFGSGTSIGTDLTLQPDGKILMVGGQDTDNDTIDDTIALARFNPDGSLDTSFGGDGKSTPDVGIAAEAKSVALQSNGQIVVGGGAAVNPTLAIPIADFFMVARLNSDGSLDPTFGTNGSVTTEVGPKSQANSIAIQSDGKIVAGGFVDQDEDGTFDADDDFALVRYMGGTASGGGGNGGGGGGGCQLAASSNRLFSNLHLFLIAIGGLYIVRRCARQD